MQPDVVDRLKHAIIINSKWNNGPDKDLQRVERRWEGKGAAVALLMRSCWPFKR